MKKQHKRYASVVAMLLAILMLVSAAFTGCGKKGGDTDSGAKATDTDTDKNDQDADKDDAGKEDEDEGGSATVGNLSLKKIGTIRHISYASEGGLVYEENDKYGVMSLDGKKDTGAKYEDVNQEDQYFEVTTKRPENEDDLEGINSTGLIDGKGNEIIPAKYAVLDKISDRYWQAIEATEKTDSDDYLVYMSSNSFISFSANEGDPRYKGVWYVYDLTTGEPVKGVSSTINYSISAYGEVIEYVTDAKEQLYVNANGDVLPENDFVFGNGCYHITQGNDQIFYDASGKELFKCAADDFQPYTTSDDGRYFLARKDVDGDKKYVVMDLTGKVVSFEFSDDYGKVIGDKYILADGVLYDFDGNKALEDSYTYNSVKTCANRDLGVMLKTDNDHYTVLDQNGKVVYTGKENDDYTFNTSDFTVSRKTKDGYLFLNWKDGDFTIQDGSSLGAGFVKSRGANNTYTLVDATSGEEVLKGYSNFYVDGNKEDGLFIYAEMADHNFEIYSIG